MLSLLCTKQCMGFSTCCHSSLSNISGCSFSYAFKALDGFPYVTTAVSLSSGCGFPHVTALSQKAVDSFPSCHCSEVSSIWGFPHVVTALFQISVDAVFVVLSRHMY